LLAKLAPRTFLMRNVHDDAPVLLRTRWALSYLRGPMTLTEIGKLEAATAASAGNTATSAAETPRAPPLVAAARDLEVASTSPARAGASSSTGAGARPIAQSGVDEKFLPATPGAQVHYQPRIGAVVRTHFVDAKGRVDDWQTAYYLAPVTGGGPDWSAAEIYQAGALAPGDTPAAGATYAAVPGAALAARNHKTYAKDLAEHVYRTVKVELQSCPSLKLTAAPGTSASEFRAQIAHSVREKRDEAVAALRRKYASRLAVLEDRQRRAGQRLTREQGEASSTTMSSALSVGGTLLGALFGGSRRSSVLTKAGTAARSVGRIGKERTDVANAEADVAALREQYAALNTELEAEARTLEATFDPAAIEVEAIPVKPRKSDIDVAELALVWQPA
jgi:hypothetical protein